MSAVDDIRKQVEELESKLSAARKSLYEAELEKHGLVPGETVLRYKGKKYILASASHFDWGKPWVTGRLCKKGGGVAKNTNCLYNDWETEPKRLEI